MQELLVKLDSHPELYWWIAITVSISWLGAHAIALRRPARMQPVDSSEGFFAAGLLLVLIAWRWPYLLTTSEYNSDESNFIAGALTLKEDPLCWRSVDGATSGPLNLYALLPLSWIGVPLGYFGARITGLVLAWAALFAVFLRLRRSAPRAHAAVALIPATAFFAGLSDPDFVHYSSESLAIFLTAFAVFLQPSRPGLAAFAAGCLPWTKLQAGPLMAALLLWQIAGLRRLLPQRRKFLRETARLFVITAAPTLLLVGLAISIGELESLVRRYFLQNLQYVGSGNSLHFAISDLARQSLASWHVPVWLGGSALIIAVAKLQAFVRREAISSLAWLGALLTITSILCVLIPARNFLHYILLIATPLTVWTGALSIPLISERRFGGLAWICLLAGTVIFATRVTQPLPEPVGQLAKQWEHPRTELGEVLRAWPDPQGKLGIWGWYPAAYVEAARAQATRDTVTAWAIGPGPQRDYYRAHYLADLKKSAPPLFLDAVGPGAQFYRERSSLAHETFPALADYVRDQYTLIADFGSARLYGRNSALLASPVDSAKLRQWMARGRINWVLAHDSAEQNYRLDIVDGEIVRMLEPPASLRWPLQGTERKVRLAFGIHPRAYQEGTTDGAAISAELHMPGHGPLLLYQRMLEPLRTHGDRGTQEVTIDLPPFPPGTAVAIRSDGGSGLHGAWDWTYVQQVRFHHSPFYSRAQFPGFNRPPDEYSSPHTYLAGEGADRRLALTPPATLSFLARGSERTLTFTFGLAPGSYSEHGYTDGAICSVEWHRPEQGHETIFSRTLDPRQRASDRGDQRCEIALPADLQRGDKLVVRLANGESDAWDWTYVADLQLE